MGAAEIILALVQLSRVGLDIAERLHKGALTPEEAVEEWERLSKDLVAANRAWVAAWRPGQPISKP